MANPLQITGLPRCPNDEKCICFPYLKKKKEKNDMEYVAVTCQKCGRKMFVLRKCARDKMYCTIHCLESGNSSKI